MASQVGNWVVLNDVDFQSWETDRFLKKLVELDVIEASETAHAKEEWLHWQHADPKRHGRPFDVYIEDSLAELDAVSAEWLESLPEDEGQSAPEDPATAYLALDGNEGSPLQWMHQLRSKATQYAEWRAFAGPNAAVDQQAVDEYLASPHANWSEEKTHEINHHLSGKVFIPQPFGTLRNAYEKQSGFAISRYMVIEVVVCILLFLLFGWLAKKVAGGGAPRGKAWNFFESFLTFIKTEIVEQGIEPRESKKFMPLFWTLFLFILGCNLTGMIPWVGAPTAAFALTAVLALVVFIVGTYLGVKKFGVAGYLKNLCPQMGLPLYMAIFVVPMVWVIEFASLFIKHGILAIRLLANMIAGHLVLLGVMGLAFGAHAASMQLGSWSALSLIAILGTTVLSFMELFVAFLQAYVFTLLAALFIGSATHHH